MHLVPGAGLEPARPCEHWHLKPARLPIPPPGLNSLRIIGIKIIEVKSEALWD